MGDGKTKALIARASAEAANKVKQMPGIVPPLGLFDPWGLATNVDQGKLLFFREVELKHGRICMLATLGILAAEKFHPIVGDAVADLPGYIVYKEEPLQKVWNVEQGDPQWPFGDDRLGRHHCARSGDWPKNTL